MSSSSPTVFVTAAGGQLGRLTVTALLDRIAPDRVIAGLRNLDSEAAAQFRARGVAVRLADYDRPDTLAAAFEGIDRLLLISSNEIGQRVQQHGNAIEAARGAGIGMLAYTSVLRADRSSLAPAEEHRQTERILRESGLPHVLLRNGWYTENYTASIPSALTHQALIGSAGTGRIAAAARADYAEAAAVVLTDAGQGTAEIYELAGDEAFTLADFAAEIARASGRPIAYRDLPEAAYRDILLGAGLPAPLAALIAGSDAAAAEGALFDDGHALSRLIGRPTTPFAVSIEKALAG